MTLDVQWFIYALVENGIFTVEDAVAIYTSLGENADLGQFAQAVLDRLAANYDEDGADELLKQLEELMNYAAVQGATDNPPPLEIPESVPEAAPAPAPAPAPVPAPAQPQPAAQEEAPEPAPQPAAGKGRRRGLVMDTPRVFPEIDIDFSAINGYEDLPSLSDTCTLDEEALEERMIFMLSCLRHLGCSDLHISAGAPPFVRRQLQIERIDSYVITREDAERLNLCLLSPERKQYFAAEQDSSFSLEVGRNRFRVCLMYQKDGISGSYRLVPDHISQLEDLGFMPRDAVTIRRLLDYHNGLILVTGPIGAGKTTTLAAMVDVANEKRADHIITIEEPIEILQVSKNCSVTQREIGKHTISYHTALKAALREDPDIIVVGEMHDLETIENAITAAETGHLVIGTLHTSDAANTLNRLLDVFPPSQQAQIRAMTAGSLRGIICQKLIPDGYGGIALVYEILVNTMSVGNLVSEGKTYQLKSTMAIGAKQGMFIMDQLILEKFNAGLLTFEAARIQMTDAATIGELEKIHAVAEAQKLKKKR